MIKDYLYVRLILESCFPVLSHLSWNRNRHSLCPTNYTG